MSIVVCGNVERGNGLGKKLGFPTLNLPYSGEDAGIFVGRVLIKKHWYKAAIHVGKRLTVDNVSSCEAYLLDWSDEVPEGTEITFELLEKIREPEKFADLKELAEQIPNDVKFVKSWYNRKENKDKIC